VGESTPQIHEVINKNNNNNAGEFSIYLCADLTAKRAKQSKHEKKEEAINIVLIIIITVPLT
jgi:hypothetical protein